MATTQLSHAPRWLAKPINGIRAQEQIPVHQELKPGYFRLLRYIDKIDETFHFTLKAYRMERAPAYVALSYTWGAPEDATFIDSPLSSRAYDEHRDIIVNGHAFKVRLNLLEFFEHLKRKDQSRLFWIDAICINQDDDREKTAQVNQMDFIYSNAESVLVWLGRSNDFIHQVVEMIDKISVASDVQWEEAVVLNELGSEETRVVLGLGAENTTNQAWVALFLFLHRSWFLRVWTLQESVLAQKVVCRCGDEDIPWEEIANVSDFLIVSAIGTYLRGTMIGDPFPIDVGAGGRLINDREHQIPAHGMHSLMRDMVFGDVKEWETQAPLFKIWYNVSDVWSDPETMLEFIVTRCSVHKCFDPKDKIFGILGLAKQVVNRCEGPKLELTADYDQDVVDVYTNLMSRLLSRCGTLTLLCKAGRGRASEIRDLPSWVTDFSQTRSIRLLEIQDSSGAIDDSHYDASRRATAGFEVRGRELYLHHHALATVTHVADGFMQMSKAIFDKTERLVLARVEQGHIRSSDVFDDIWRTMLADCHGMNAMERYSDNVLRQSFRQFLLLQCWTRLLGLSSKESKTETFATLKSLQFLMSLDESDNVSPLSSAIGMTVQDAAGLYNASLPFFSIVTKTMAYRTLFLLDDGRIGLGPDNMEPGDVLSIVADGGRTPLIFRRTHAEDNKWTLIGEAYVRGLMYDEGVDQMEAEGKSWQKICVV